jgi:hypothetical protein
MSCTGKERRDGIDFDSLIAQLTDHALGKIELTPAQVCSIEILVRTAFADSRR